MKYWNVINNCNTTYTGFGVSYVTNNEWINPGLGFVTQHEQKAKLCFITHGELNLRGICYLGMEFWEYPILITLSTLFSGQFITNENSLLV